MTNTEQVALMAHLMRRTSFGASRDELEAYVAKGYEATVEELLHPEDQPSFDDDLIYRYVPYFRSGTAVQGFQCYWMYRMISTRRPLEEKMTLFWHHLFATGFSKVENAPQMNRQIAMFRRHGLGDFRTLLLELSRDPAMIFWLDNCENHKGAPNENYGRELLELFSMGVGNYTEEDVKACARAFTGWTMVLGLPRYPYGEHFNEFEYRPEDHDDQEKVFLGQRGRFNGEDIIDIIVRNPATAIFLGRRLYTFFVADEPDQAAINILADSFVQNHGQIRPVLRTLFNSDFFKSEKARFAKVKSPAELVAGVMRLVDEYTSPKPDIHTIAAACNYMGQELLNPPTVEGWHTGQEWVDSGALVERVNFAAEQAGDLLKPGVRRIVNRLAALGPSVTPAQLVDGCLDLAGPVRVSPEKRHDLIAHVGRGGELGWKTDAERHGFNARVATLLQLIVSTPEFQLA